LPLCASGLVIDAEIGQAVAFAGPLKHAGYPITAGVRMILVLFLYVEDFHYGPYLTRARADCPCTGADRPPVSKIQVATSAARSSEVCAGDQATANGTAEKLNSGGEAGGFVVYRQTVELVNMLEKPMAFTQDDVQ
jgi:hypothetical protein